MERDEPLTLLDCGCRVFSFNDGYNVDITFCPIHNAAPALLAACEYMVAASEHGATDERILEDMQAGIPEMKAAIAKARGN